MSNNDLKSLPQKYDHNASHVAAAAVSTHVCRPRRAWVLLGVVLIACCQLAGVTGVRTKLKRQLGYCFLKQNDAQI